MTEGPSSRSLMISYPGWRAITEHATDADLAIGFGMDFYSRGM